MGNHSSAGGFSKNSDTSEHSSIPDQNKSEVILSMSQKLAKLLAEKSHNDNCVQGFISFKCFHKFVFPQNEVVASKVFRYMAMSVGYPNDCQLLKEKDFYTQADRILGILSSKEISIMYVSMFGANNEITPENLHDLLMCGYKLAMDHYPNGPQSCSYILRTIQAVVDSAFHKKNVLSVNFISNWTDDHLPHFLQRLHQYVVHMFSVAYHNIIDKVEVSNRAVIELSTPVLEKAGFKFECGNREPLLPLSQVWLLALSLPDLYTMPQTSPQSPATPKSTKFYLAKMLGFSCPSHWTLLYNSDQHGLGANRFVYHVSDYKGPTLTFIRGEQNVEFCLGATQEWRESHQYWGSDQSIIIQMLPLYNVLLRGAKIMYMNLSIRGYPFGIRAGASPQSPLIEVDINFEKITYSKIPYQIYGVEVWGCGHQQQRDQQIDIKKWEKKEVEKARKVKMSAADWNNHPDRYLLELAGRPSYSST